MCRPRASFPSDHQPRASQHRVEQETTTYDLTVMPESTGGYGPVRAFMLNFLLPFSLMQRPILTMVIYQAVWRGLTVAPWRYAYGCCQPGTGIVQLSESAGGVTMTSALPVNGNQLRVLLVEDNAADA